MPENARLSLWEAVRGHSKFLSERRTLVVQSVPCRIFIPISYLMHLSLQQRLKHFLHLRG